MRIDVTGVHFSDLNPSFCDNLNDIRLDLNVWTKVKGNYRFFNYRLDETFSEFTYDSSPIPYSKFYQMLDPL